MATAARFSAASRRIGELCDGLIGDDRELRRALLETIRSALGFDAFAWLVTDPVTCVGSSPLAEVPFLAELPEAIRLKYLTTVNRWTVLDGAVGLLAQATRGDLTQSRMWRELLRLHGVIDAASVVFRDRNGCWGFLELWRSSRGSPFNAAEAQFLTGVAEPITSALRRCQARTFTTAATEPTRPGTGPVMLLLSPSLAVRAQTAEVESYLRALVPPTAGAAPVPAGAYNVAAQLLALEAGVDDHPAWARVHLTGGIWLTLKAARIEVDAAGAEPDIAVSIELASTRERASLVARAFALTSREAALIDRMTGGGDTRSLARSMRVSENTVQDHLKSIFAKTGVRSRSALLSAITGR